MCRCPISSSVRDDETIVENGSNGGFHLLPIEIAAGATWTGYVDMTPSERISHLLKFFSRLGDEMYVGVITPMMFGGKAHNVGLSTIGISVGTKVGYVIAVCAEVVGENVANLGPCKSKGFCDACPHDGFAVTTNDAVSGNAYGVSVGREYDKVKDVLFCHRSFNQNFD